MSCQPVDAVFGFFFNLKGALITCPLKVVEDGPCKVAFNVNAVLPDCLHGLC